MALLRTCDRDGCGATAPNEYGYERETEIPDGWWVLTRGDAGEDENASWDFCSLACVTAWTTAATRPTFVT